MIPMCLTTAASLLVCSALALGAPAQSKADPFDASVRRLRDAVTGHRDGRHLEILASLRSLKDPSLAPFFSRLTSSDDPLIQINGILGLAETSPEHLIDPWLVSRLTTEAARLQAINLAIGLELIDTAQMRTILAWENLQDTLQAALLAELIARDEDVDPKVLERLAASENQKVRAVAAMLLTQTTGERAPFESFRAELEELPADERHNAFMWLANDAGQYRLEHMLWWLEELATASDADEPLAMLAIESALLINPDAGAALWQSHLARDPSHGQRVAHGLLLLDVAREVEIPPALFDEVRDGEELTEKIADAGSALAMARESAAEPLLALLALDHRRSAADVAVGGKLLPPDQAALLYKAMIDRAMDGSADSSVRPLRAELAVRAVPLLFEISPDAVEELLVAAPDDSQNQEMILIGLLGATDSRAGETARTVKRLGFGPADSLALLLIAKHAPAGELRQDELANLGMLAAGGGRLSPALAAEAAWLYIKHTGKIELAMSRLFTPGE